MKALVIGGDGLIGGVLSGALESAGNTVLRTTRRPGRNGEGWLHLDLAGPLPARLPMCEVAFFCAAMTSFADCRAMPDLATRVNVQAPAELATRMAGQGARVVLLSTSAVLDCGEPRMRADRPYSPRGAYGAQKAAAERAFLALGRTATVLRLTKVLTRADARLAEWARELGAGRPVRAFEDHRISPVGETDVAAALLAIARDGEGGIYQISARDDWSYADVARQLARRIHAPEALVHAHLASGAGIPPDEVTPYTSLDTSRLADLSGFVPPTASQVLDRVLP